MTEYSIANALKGLFEEKLISEINQHALIQTFKEDEVLMEPGAYIRNTVIVLEGSLKVSRENLEDEGEFFLYHIKEREACALSMMCANTYKPSLVRVAADEETKALVVPLHTSELWLSKYRTWQKFVISNYRERFDEVLRTLDQVAFRALDERLEFYLQRLAKQKDTNIIQTTHQAIAKDLNSSREVISRLLKKMQQKGLVQLGRNEIQIFY